MYEFHPIAFLYLEGAEILSIYKARIYLDDNRGIIFLRPVEKILDCDFASLDFFGKTVEDEFQFIDLRFHNSGLRPAYHPLTTPMGLIFATFLARPAL